MNYLVKEWDTKYSEKDYEIIFINCICPLLLIYYVLTFQE
jgi:hypothetical protein